MADEYYEISPKINDIDFYIGGVKVESYISSTSDVETSATRVANASSSILIQSSYNNPFIRKIVEAKSDINISLTKEVTPLEVLNVLSIIHIQSELLASAKKIATASSAINIESSSTTSLQRITKFVSDAHIVSSAIPHVIKIAKASSQSSLSISSEFKVKFISFVRETFLITSRLNINPPIRFSPSYIDDTSIRTLFTLDNKPLTNHNRQFDTSLSPIFVENANWNNRKSRYYKMSSKSGRRTFSLSWTMIPNAMSDTVDSRHGRDFLNSIAKDPDIHELKILNQDENGTTAYTETSYRVFVRSYSETLIRRYIHQGVYLYDCSLTLEEA